MSEPAQADAYQRAVNLQRGLFAAKPFGDLGLAQALFDQRRNAGQNFSDWRDVWL
jgi:hypothetical protein